MSYRSGRLIRDYLYVVLHVLLIRDPDDNCCHIILTRDLLLPLHNNLQNQLFPVHEFDGGHRYHWNWCR